MRGELECLKQTDDDSDEVINHEAGFSAWAGTAEIGYGNNYASGKWRRPRKWRLHYSVSFCLLSERSLMTERSPRPPAPFVFDCRELLSAKELSDEDVDHQLG